MTDLDNQGIITVLEEIREAIENLNPERHMSQTCQHHKCHYFTEYLAKGPADLTHEGYHAAEKKNKEVQARPLTNTRIRQAEQWEVRLRL